jgi:hypothetical protein
MIVDAVASAPMIAVRISARRFAQKSGFGERR